MFFMLAASYVWLLYPVSDMKALAPVHAVWYHGSTIEQVAYRPMLL
jgi:hypothetical protein